MHSEGRRGVSIASTMMRMKVGRITSTYIRLASPVQQDTSDSPNIPSAPFRIPLIPLPTVIPVPMRAPERGLERQDGPGTPFPHGEGPEWGPVEKTRYSENKAKLALCHSAC